MQLTQLHFSIIPNVFFFDVMFNCITNSFEFPLHCLSPVTLLGNSSQYFRNDISPRRCYFRSEIDVSKKNEIFPLNYFLKLSTDRIKWEYNLWYLNPAWNSFAHVVNRFNWNYLVICCMIILFNFRRCSQQKNMSPIMVDIIFFLLFLQKINSHHSFTGAADRNYHKRNNRNIQRTKNGM